MMTAAAAAAARTRMLPLALESYNDGESGGIRRRWDESLCSSRSFDTSAPAGWGVTAERAAEILRSAVGLQSTTARNGAKVTSRSGGLE